MGLSLLTRLSLSLPPAEPCNPEICEACNVPTTSLISGGGRGGGPEASITCKENPVPGV